MLQWLAQSLITRKIPYRQKKPGEGGGREGGTEGEREERGRREGGEREERGRREGGEREERGREGEKEGGREGGREGRRERGRERGREGGRRKRGKEGGRESHKRGHMYIVAIIGLTCVHQEQEKILEIQFSNTVVYPKENNTMQLIYMYMYMTVGNIRTQTHTCTQTSMEHVIITLYVWETRIEL